MPEQSRFDQLKTRVVEHLQTFLDKKEPVLLYEPITYTMSAGGKRLRPVMTCIACEAVGGTVDDALDAAVALEFLHNFTLIHDDIMDDDDMRRGRETVHKKWDENVAILSGDALLVIAYQAISQCAPEKLPVVIDYFSNGILKVCEGQTYDKEFETRESVTLNEYFDMIDKKTAELFAVSCAIGATLGNGSDEQVAALRLYGMKLGRAFQIQDDLLDVTADQDVLGKDIGSDIEENKKTFLVSHALEHAVHKDKEKLKLLLQKGKITSQDVSDVIDVFEHAGTIQAARNIISECIKDARTALQSFNESDAKNQLLLLLEMIEKRNS